MGFHPKFKLKKKFKFQCKLVWSIPLSHWIKGKSCVICGYRPWTVLSWKGAHEVLSSPHGHWEKKEFDLKGHWGGLLSHRPFLLIHLKAEVTGCHLSRDRSRVSLRKPGSVRTYSQCLVTEPWLIFWTSLGNPEVSSSGQSPTKPAGTQAISIFRSGFPCWDSSLHLLTSCYPRQMTAF